MVKLAKRDCHRQLVANPLLPKVEDISCSEIIAKDSELYLVLPVLSPCPRTFDNDSSFNSPTRVSLDGLPVAQGDQAE